MTEKAYFNRCPQCDEVRIDHLELDGERITCLTCGHVYSLSFSPSPSDVLPQEVYEEVKARAKADKEPTDPETT